WVATNGLPETLGTSGLKPATDERYAGFSDVANEYLDCVTHGTVGQIWRFVDPVRLQWRLRNWLPFMVTDEEARRLLPEILDFPANDIWTGTEDLSFLEVTPHVSASAEDAGIPIAPWYLDHFSYMVVAPIQFVASADIAKADVASTPIVIDNLPSDRNIVMGKSVLDGQWYVVGVYSPVP
ncbi:MAG: hypothetical protein M9950_09955, partial [Thermomicrobiales bacterium]|nr:hypothetical protein [Thermomicrobiales bacterium]